MQANKSKGIKTSMNMSGWQNWILINLKWIVSATVILLVGIGAFGVIKERARAKERAASNLLYSVRGAAEKDVNLKNYAKAVEKYQPIFEKFPKSRAAYEANLMIGDIWMDAGDNSKAAAAYETAYTKGPDSFSKFLAKYNQALALEAGKEYAKAEMAYNETLNGNGAEFLRPEILMAKARCLEAQKRFGEARSVYQEIRDKFASNGFYAAAASAFLGDLPK